MHTVWIQGLVLATGCLGGSELERCDGLDNDGNGVVDDIAAGPDTWFADLDGDGFGDVGAPRCPEATDAVTNDEDCDDASVAVRPGRSEICAPGPARDDDCDPLTADPVASVGDLPFDGLADALAADVPGERVVVVCDGNELVAPALSVAGTVTVRSASGDPAAVTLTSDGGALFELTNGRSDLTLQGVSVQGGVGEIGGAVTGGRLDGADVTLWGAVTLRAVRASDHQATHGGVVAAERVTVADSELVGNHATETGGAIHARDVALTGSVLEDGSARAGGAVWAAGSVVSTATRFEGNVATERGGAVLANTTSSFADATFRNNHAARGGALALVNPAMLPDQQLMLNDSTVEGNTADEWGGALLLDALVLVDATGTVLSSNVARTGGGGGGWGGAVNLTVVPAVGDLTWLGGTFRDNAAGASGGGLLASCDGEANMRLTALTLVDNEAADGAGLYVNTACTASIADATLSGNVASGAGGGLFLGSGAQVDMVDSSLTGHRAELAAAAFLAGSTHLSLLDSEVLRNDASDEDSGAIHLVDLPIVSPSLQVSNTDFGEKGPDDNGWFDVVMGALDPDAVGYRWEHGAGDDASFLCDLEGCR
ncbi:MAG: putative metal-binding motif-containing protein [Myxococcales bacterium]|nr:putative metal-binding motif-containing protein [Myxococcales bacterium]